MPLRLHSQEVTAQRSSVSSRPRRQGWQREGPHPFLAYPTTSYSSWLYAYTGYSELSLDLRPVQEGNATFIRDVLRYLEKSNYNPRARIFICDADQMALEMPSCRVESYFCTKWPGQRKAPDYSVHGGERIPSPRPGAMQPHGLEFFTVAPQRFACVTAPEPASFGHYFEDGSRADMPFRQGWQRCGLQGQHVVAFDDRHFSRHAIAKQGSELVDKVLAGPHV
ncbi:hypothetical protein Cob_v002981 [Colletotrichum orbiculare MAFF 240422]|uniref:Uncharacterized protein n=1 Tax=Colletotrichum orbiculare (strain 104-T / ATCC 96160 / CBS 514.97 / LARS 414 / MAFF 240422) TaxID=1213857 RepID=A0A484G046_COLOR|nr:hypothetical protein Cob_v002981 [Colletotrichum orbiculare MAFF 240422]